MQNNHLKKQSLEEKYLPSKPCSCPECRAYCRRPGWWTVKEASRIISAGLGMRMMLELSPDRTFGVLSPAFRGCEGFFALQEFANAGCNFLENGLCTLFSTGLEPLECRFCHHTRRGLGSMCHADIERDWRTEDGRMLVSRWIEWTGIAEMTGPDTMELQPVENGLRG